MRTDSAGVTCHVGADCYCDSHWGSVYIVAMRVERQEVVTLCRDASGEKGSGRVDSHAGSVLLNHSCDPRGSWVLKGLVSGCKGVKEIMLFAVTSKHSGFSA